MATILEIKKEMESSHMIHRGQVHSDAAEQTETSRILLLTMSEKQSELDALPGRAVAAAARGAREALAIPAEFCRRS